MNALIPQLSNIAAASSEPTGRRQFLQAGAGVAALVALSSAGIAQATCAPTTWQLTAGQTIPVGTVTVTNDATNLYVTYTLTYPGATFGTLHLWVGSDLTNVPANPNGIPVPGKFPHQANASGQTSYMFTIPLVNLNIQDIRDVCNQILYVVAHAEVKMPDGKNETAFGGPNGINIKEPGRWWYYGAYTLCCDTPPVVEICNTAFAKGGYVFTTDKRSNPEGLPSLELSRNRWGWAINLTTSAIGTTTTYEIYAGAGLNNTTNGTRVGELVVEWNSPGSLVVTYKMDRGCAMKEVHLYASDNKPTTMAPGQYGNLQYFGSANKQSQWTFTVSASDSNGDGIWLIAHAVVCCNCC